jgi:transcriptional regulator with XRE-family HTH domain
MSEERQDAPFKSLGDELKTLRQKKHESVAEVSGAVEIDEQRLQRIELGQERPTEDILMLLINHFGMRDDEAAKLWQLAGYDQPRDGHSSQDETSNNRTMVMIMAVDPRIIYSDSAQITANDQGVVINFSQGAGTPQVMTTARIGMSREQAYGVLRTLQQVLDGSKAQPRQLPASTSTSQPAPEKDAEDTSGA